MNQAAGSQPFRIRIKIVGSYSVGRTSIFNRLNKAENSTPYWQDAYPMYIEVIFWNERFCDQDVKFIILDSIGAENLRNTLSNSLSADGIIFVYDITNKYSFQALKRAFETDTKVDQRPYCRILIGNKIDLEEHRQVSYEEARLLAEKFGEMEFFEVSAKTGDGLEHAFQRISKRILERKIMDEKKEDLVIKLEKKNDQKGDRKSWCIS